MRLWLLTSEPGPPAVTLAGAAVESCGDDHQKKQQQHLHDIVVVVVVAVVGFPLTLVL